MKKIVLALVAMLSVATLSSAQNNNVSMKNTLKLGVMGGASVPMSNAGGNLGVDIGFQHLITPNVGLGIATGYNQFFGKTNKVGAVDIDNNNFGIVPVAALFRYYPSAEGVYFGTDLGYGFIVGDNKVAAKFTEERPAGGLYIKPEIGYHNRNWNFFVHYTKVFTGDAGNIAVLNNTQKYNAGTIGVGVSYNFGLGK